VPFFLGLLVAAVALYLGTSHIGLHILGGLCLGLFWQQTLLVGHDAGHASVSGDMCNDKWTGLLVGTILNGFSFNWWRVSHNTHHITTNSIEHDPDIQHMPFVAISERFLEGVYSTYHEQKFEFDTVARLLITKQHVLFWIIMVFARFFVHIQGMLLLLNFNKRVPDRFLDLIGMFVYFGWVVGLVYFAGAACGRDTWSMVAFTAAAHLVAAIIHMQITLNHFASPDHSDKHSLGPRDGQDFVTAQLRGTCDISVPLSLDWFFGGLQFQVEHHLCPRMPRHNLRAFTLEIMALSRKHDLPYVSRSIPDALGCVLHRLQAVALEAVTHPLSTAK